MVMCLHMYVNNCFLFFRFVELSLKGLDGFAQGACPCVLIIHSVACFNLMQALVAQHFHEGQSLYTLHQHINHSCIHTQYTSPAPSGSSLLCALNIIMQLKFTTECFSIFAEDCLPHIYLYITYKYIFV